MIKKHLLFGFLGCWLWASFLFPQEPNPFNKNQISELVDTSNGALKLTYKDFSIPSSGKYVSVLRYYNSQSLVDGLFGYGWHSNIDLLFRYRPKEIKKVEKFSLDGNLIGTSTYETEEAIEIIEATGWINIFKNKNGTISSIYGELDTIKKIDGGFLKTASNQDKYYFTHCVLEEEIPIPSDQQREYLEDGKKYIEITKYSTSSTLGFSKRGLYRLSKIEYKDGNILNFSYNPNGFLIYFESFPNKKLTFTYNPMGKIASVMDFTGRQYTYEYDSKGNLISVKNPENIITSFKYDDFHNLTKIISSKERTTEIAYNLDDMAVSVTYPSGAKINYLYETIPGKGLVTTIIDPLGNKTIHSYEPGYYEEKEKALIITDAEGNVWKKYRDARKNIIKEIDPNGGITLYDYDLNGNLIKKVDAEGNVWKYEYNDKNLLTRSIAPNGATFKFTYDNKKNLIEIEDPYGKTSKRKYNNNGQMTQKTDENGNTSIYTYENGNLIEEIDPLGNKTIYTYDQLGNKISMQDANNFTTQYTYDSMNRVIQITNPDNTSKKYVYDCCDLIEIIDENNNSIKYEYDDMGRVIKEIDALNNETNYEYDLAGNLIKKIDKNKNIWSFEWNKLGKMTSLSDPMGNTIKYEYDGVGNMIKETDAIGRITTYSYDKLNRLLSIKINNTEVIKYTYDSVGNRLSITDAEGRITSFEYDLLNRPIKRTSPGGEETLFTYDNVGNLISASSSYGISIEYTYNKNNKPIEIKDENGKIVEAYTYDGTGKILSKRDARGTISYTYNSRNKPIEVISPNNEKSYYTYDNVNNIIAIKDREGATTRYFYDKLNRLSSITDPMGNKTYVKRDELGRVISITDPNGNTTYFEYDNANRKIKETYADGSAQSFAYDGAGRMTSLKDQNGSLIKFFYNDLNQITKKEYPDGSSAEFEYNKIGMMTRAKNSISEVSFSYDDAGNLTKETQNGKDIIYTYDMKNQKRTIKYPSGKIITERYNKKGRLLEVLNNGQTIATYTYDTEERLEKRNYSNNINTTFSYDGFNRLKTLKCGTISFIFAYNYNYNKEDNKSSIEALHNGSLSEAYAYDEAQRLKGFKRGDLSNGDIPNPIEEITYILDSVGNWLKKNDEERKCNNVNEYTTIGTTTFAYDKNGRLIEDGKHIYSYDYENQLVEIKKKIGGDILARYGYDALGRRISKETTITTTYIYDQARLIEEWSGGTATTSYIYGAGIDEVIVMEKENKRYFYHHNELGNCLALTDETGSIVETYSYDPYGNSKIFDKNGNLIEKSSVGNNLLFTGKFFDIETGFYYFRARYYSPEMGRFITKDPAGYTEGMNLYQYVLSNPINRIDPTGLYSVEFTISSEKWTGWLPDILKKYTPEGQVSISYSRENECCEEGPHEGEYVTNWELGVSAGISWTLRDIAPPGLGFQVPIVNIWLGLKVTIAVSISGELSGGSDKCNDTYKGKGCITGGGSINADFGGGIKIVEAYVGGGVNVTVKICLEASISGACVIGELCAGGEIYGKVRFDIWIKTWEFQYSFFSIEGCWEIFRKCI